jgi:hypothetical protein
MQFLSAPSKYQKQDSREAPARDHSGPEDPQDKSGMEQYGFHYLQPNAAVGLEKRTHIKKPFLGPLSNGCIGPKRQKLGRTQPATARSGDLAIPWLSA